MEASAEADWLILCRQEKLLASQQATVSETDTGGKVEYTQARERNLLKELGNLAP